MILISKYGHMVSSDGYEGLHELHLFAEEVGLKYSWVNGVPERPHYILTTTRAENRAIAKGAKKIKKMEGFWDVYK